MRKTDLDKLGSPLASLHNAIAKIEGRYARTKSSNGTKRKKKFLIACDWAQSGEICVKAHTLGEAIKEVEDSDDPLPDGDYIDGSFRVNKEVTEFINSEEYKSNK
jgi:hypothetical protein